VRRFVRRLARDEVEADRDALVAAHRRRELDLFRAGNAGDCGSDAALRHMHN